MSGGQLVNSAADNIAVIPSNQNQGSQMGKEVMDQLQDRQSMGIGSLEGIAGKFATTSKPSQLEQNERSNFPGQLGQMNGP